MACLRGKKTQRLEREWDYKVLPSRPGEKLSRQTKEKSIFIVVICATPVGRRKWTRRQGKGGEKSRGPLGVSYTFNRSFISKKARKDEGKDGGRMQDAAQVSSPPRLSKTEEKKLCENDVQTKEGTGHRETEPLRGNVYSLRLQKNAGRRRGRNRDGSYPP